MSLRSPEEILAADSGGPVELAEGVYWVGHHLPGDPFQCHAYLIVHGDQSVLLDPGSRLTFAHTLAKVRQVIPFEDIRYFVCHHQDPDITGAMDIIDGLVTRPDAVLVSHERARALLQHLALRLPFWLVEDHDWRLDLGGRVLEFVFTPYMHFPGAFTTFDRASGVLFSSDIFGAVGDDMPLVATDERHFDAIRLFHEHYMPSREIVTWGLERLEALPLALIAPQHGAIIPGPLIAPIIARLKNLECGLYLFARGDTNLRRLSDLNQHMRAVMKAIVLQREFKDVAVPLLQLVQTVLPVVDLAFFVDAGDEGTLVLSRENQFHGAPAVAPPEVAALLAVRVATGAPDSHEPRLVTSVVRLGDGPARPALAVPLFHPERGVVDGVAVLVLGTEDAVGPAAVGPLLDDLWVPLEAAIARERSLRALERDHARVYEESIRDPLTQLYNRTYMDDQVARTLEQRRRDPSVKLAVILFDIDHFKDVNDTWGHVAGDVVLHAVAQIIVAGCRNVDLAVRFGGEEFAVFLWGADVDAAAAVAERVRLEVARTDTPVTHGIVRVTISAGVATHAAGDTLAALLEAADGALYAAKDSGRNRVCVAGLGEAPP